jgi:hypothetical protein
MHKHIYYIINQRHNDLFQTIRINVDADLFFKIKHKLHNPLRREILNGLDEMDII